MAEKNQTAGTLFSQAAVDRRDAPPPELVEAIRYLLYAEWFYSEKFWTFRTDIEKSGAIWSLEDKRFVDLLLAFRTDFAQFLDAQEKASERFNQVMPREVAERAAMQLTSLSRESENDKRAIIEAFVAAFPENVRRSLRTAATPDDSGISPLSRAISTATTPEGFTDAVARVVSATEAPVAREETERMVRDYVRQDNVLELLRKDRVIRAGMTAAGDRALAPGEEVARVRRPDVFLAIYDEKSKEETRKPQTEQQPLPVIERQAVFATRAIEAASAVSRVPKGEPVRLFESLARDAGPGRQAFAAWLDNRINQLSPEAREAVVTRVIDQSVGRVFTNIESFTDRIGKGAVAAIKTAGAGGFQFAPSAGGSPAIGGVGGLGRILADAGTAVFGRQIDERVVSMIEADLRWRVVAAPILAASSRFSLAKITSPLLAATGAGAGTRYVPPPIGAQPPGIFFAAPAIGPAGNLAIAEHPGLILQRIEMISLVLTYQGLPETYLLARSPDVGGFVLSSLFQQAAGGAGRSLVTRAGAAGAAQFSIKIGTRVFAIPGLARLFGFLAGPPGAALSLASFFLPVEKILKWPFSMISRLGRGEILQWGKMKAAFSNFIASWNSNWSLTVKNEKKAWMWIAGPILLLLAIISLVTSLSMMTYTTALASPAAATGEESGPLVSQYNGPPPDPAPIVGCPIAPGAGSVSQEPYDPGGSHKRTDAYDFAAATNTPVYATHAGVVVIADGGLPPGFCAQPGTAASWGNRVAIQGALPTGGAYYTIYAHLMPNLLVSVGQQVAAGAPIGFVDTTGYTYGSNGLCTGTHLHYEYRENLGVPLLPPGRLVLPAGCP